MRRLISFFLTRALLASGIFLLTRDMHGSPHIVFGVLAAGATLAFARAVWIWEDFLRPWFYGGPRPRLDAPTPMAAR
jgi:hypothetical protein